MKKMVIPVICGIVKERTNVPVMHPSRPHIPNFVCFVVIPVQQDQTSSRAPALPCPPSAVIILHRPPGRLHSTPHLDQTAPTEEEICNHWLPPCPRFQRNPFTKIEGQAANVSQDANSFLNEFKREPVEGANAIAKIRNFPRGDRTKSRVRRSRKVVA